MEVTGELLPPIDPVIARTSLEGITALLEWQKNTINKAEQASIRLSRLISDVSENNYWMIGEFASEREYVAKTFTQSESQYYILRRIGKALRNFPLSELEKIGISKCQDLVRIYNHDGGIISPNWWIWARTETRDEFRKRVRSYVARALPAPKKDPEDVIMSFKVWSSAVPMMERALEIAGMESGSTCKSHNLNLIVADFLSGHNEEGARLKGKYNLAIEIVGRIIESLNSKEDPTVFDRLWGRIHSCLTKAKSD